MIEPSPTGHRATCDKCKTSVDFHLARPEEAASQAKALGWIDHARKNVSAAKREWSCPACAPKGGAGMGHSTSKIKMPWE